MNKLKSELSKLINNQNSPELTNIANEISKLLNLLNNLPGVVYHCKNDPKWTMEFLSEECENLTGYSPSELINNKYCSYNDLIHPLDRTFVWETVQEALKENQNYNLEYRINTRLGEEKWVFEKGRGVYDSEGKLLFLEGFILDISERKKIEEEKNLLISLTHKITEAQDFQTALSITLKEVCETTNWDFGEAWFPNDYNNLLEYIAAWYSPSQNKLPSYSLSLEEFKQKSLQYVFPKSIGLPGKIWELRQPYWIQNISIETSFLRHKLAFDCGLKAGFGVPIIAEQEIVAILIFFMRQSLKQDEAMLSLVRGVAYQLGNIFKHKKTEISLQESQRQLTGLINASSGIFFRLSYDLNWSKTYVSDGCEELTGYTKEELLDDQSFNLSEITHPLDLEKLINIIENSIKNKTSYVLEYRIFTKNNQEKWVWEKGHGVFNSDGKLLGIEGFITDISERKKMEQALQETELKYRSIFENAIEGIFQTTPDGHYLSANSSLAKIYGYNSPEELKQNLSDIENQLYVNPETRKNFISLFKKDGYVSGFESQVYRADGTIIWISENARAVKNKDGILLYYEGTVEDITKYKKAKEQLHRQAFYDNLTQLPNRAFFLQKLDNLIDKFKKNSYNYEQFAILFLDGDRFKIVNDSLGHLVGDELLKAIAKRLVKCVRKQDTLARLGGDEFLILLENTESIQKVIQIAERIINELKEPFYIAGNQIFSGVSIGILFSTSLEEEGMRYLTPSKLLRNADIALYKAKAKGKGCYQIFQHNMQIEALAELNLETELHHAITNREFKVYYQPIMSLLTKKIESFEVLIYWQHPRKGLIAPQEFIHIAEETGLIIPIGYWALEEACFQIAKWEKNLKKIVPKFSNNIKVNINLSSAQFSDDKLLEKIDSILNKTKVLPEHIILEVTEKSYLINKELTIKKLKELQFRKITILIDNFGMGYSSFNYLYELPIEGLKIASSLVSEIETNLAKQKITKAIINLAKDLDLEVILQGIDTLEQLEKLQNIGCKLGQGNVLSEPLDQEQSSLFLLKNS